MPLQKWEPGLSGFICLPEHTDDNPPRLYFVADLDEKGLYTVRTSLISWSEAYYDKMPQLAAQEGRMAFTTLELKTYKEWVSRGYFRPKSETPAELKTTQPFEIIHKSKKLPSKLIHTSSRQSTPSLEAFDSLFDKLAGEAVDTAEFSAAKPRQEGRIPEIIKKKVASLWARGICYPDPTKSACFRIADSKKGKGGPYNYFSYFKSTQTISTNWEYLVQIASFHDLIAEYGYHPEWMKFEYHESVPPVWLSIDIGIKFPDGRKGFVEVKERREQWETLIAKVKSLGHKGVDLNAPDRGNDPLRKAKYIMAGQPDFFVGYYGDGFDTYKILYNSNNRFALEASTLPKVSNIVTSDKVELIEKLLLFLQKGIQKPTEVIKYLQSREKCSRVDCKNIGCETLISHFSGTRSWDRNALDKFFEWSWRWYTQNKYEEPVNIVFILPRVAQFLEMQMGWDEITVLKNFKMEFKGNLRIRRELPIPPCLWRGDRLDKKASIYLEKELLKSDKGLACDFYLKAPFPPMVVEVKVAVPQNAEQVFNTFLNDIDKCRKWLKPELAPIIERKFGIKRFDYALAILIDLTGVGVYSSQWDSKVDEEALYREGIFARLISPYSCAKNC